MKAEHVKNEGEVESTLKTQMQKRVPEFPNRSQVRTFRKKLENEYSVINS